MLAIQKQYIICIHQHNQQKYQHFLNLVTVTPAVENNLSVGVEIGTCFVSTIPPFKEFCTLGVTSIVNRVFK